MRGVCGTIILLSLAMATGAAAAPPVVTGCPERYDPVPAARPLGAGPLALAAIHCLEDPANVVVPSPDGTAVFAFWVLEGLWLGTLGAKPALRRFEADVAALNPSFGNLPFAWSKTSRSVFGVRQQKEKPQGGHALGPLRTYLFGIDGTDVPLPVLTHPAGPLDQMFWVGDDGLALAAFGTMGRYYRPAHDDAHPTIALVDARAGKVLQSAEIADIFRGAGRQRIEAAASVVDRTGRGHVLIAVTPNRLVLWGQGGPPRVVPVVADGLFPFALTPDGQSVLMMRNLIATGVICERDPHCPAPEPQSGPLAELRDLRSGKAIWSISGTAKGFTQSDAPAISPDGRYALLTLPDSGHGDTIALVSMKEGAVRQELPKTGEGTFGFSRDGRAAWVSSGGRLVTYALGSR